jgi:hypothetical protein
VDAPIPLGGASFDGPVLRADPQGQDPSALRAAGILDNRLTAAAPSDRSFDKSLAAGPDDPPHSVTVLVGPEGGWTMTEESKWPLSVNLGTQILRSETACMAAAILVGSQLWSEIGSFQV